MQQKSEGYAEKTTRLSNRLEAAEQFLKQLPGKLEVSVWGGSNCLSFTRCEDGWCLWYSAEPDGQRVTEAPVSVKAIAAQLLPELVDTLFARISDQTAQVDAGLEALDTIEFLRDGEEVKSDLL